MRRLAIALLTLACVPSVAKAEPPTYMVNGNLLQNYCESHRTAAMGYVLGATDMEEIKDNLIDKPTVCIAVETDAEQILDVTCNYLKAHPETGQNPASYLVHLANLEAWPCQ